MQQENITENILENPCDANFIKDMNSFPLQYLGSKKRIADWILEHISSKFEGRNIFIDLFAGTGVVSRAALVNGYEVVSNDLQPYSYQFLKGNFESISESDRHRIIKSLEGVLCETKIIKSCPKRFLDDYHKESGFFKTGVNSKNWKEYKRYCEETQHVNTWSSKKRKNYSLFSSYYRNTYFGTRQCLELDIVRNLIDAEESIGNKLLLEACAISALSYCVSSTTHLAQFLKPNSLKSTQDLLKRRQKSIIQFMIEKMSLYSFPASYKESVKEVHNMDYKCLLKTIYDQDQFANAVLYCDPPYFKEHYSRYYHVLDTFILYDYPDISINKQTRKISAGRYRENRLVSDFGLRAKALQGFKSILEFGKKTHIPVIFSYANSSIVTLDKIKTEIENYGLNYKIETIELMHSSQGRYSNKSVTEYLIFAYGK